VTTFIFGSKAIAWYYTFAYKQVMYDETTENIKN